MNAEGVGMPEIPFLGKEAVKKYGSLIDELSKKHGTDPDMVRAIMYSENARGHHAGFNDLFDKVGISKTKMPMNINPTLWLDLLPEAKNLDSPIDNIEASVVLIKKLTSRVRKPTAAKVGSLYNSLAKERTSEFGNYIGRIYDEKPWLDR